MSIERVMSFQFIIYNVLFIVVMFRYCLGTGENWFLLKPVNQMHVFATDLSQEHDVQWLSFGDVVHQCFWFFVFRIYVILLFFTFERFYTIRF